MAFIRSTVKEVKQSETPAERLLETTVHKLAKQRMAAAAKAQRAAAIHFVVACVDRPGWDVLATSLVRLAWGEAPVLALLSKAGSQTGQSCMQMPYVTHDSFSHTHESTFPSVKPAKYHYHTTTRC